jgi:disulfide bond formation protein DsbB
MMSVFWSLLDSATRRVFAAISLACVSMLAFGLFLQFHYSIEPCPMCIVQRDALLMVAIIAALTSASGKKSKQIWGASLLFISAVFGAFVAARQTWLQWYPPEIATCGRDFYGMIESFPLSRAIPMIFKGSGDCSKIDWTFLGGSIANWSFLAFTTFAVLALLIVWRKARH